MQGSAAFSSLFCGGHVSCLLIGFCWLSIAIVEDISSDLLELDFSCGKLNQNHQLMKQRFSNIIQLYSEVKQLSKRFFLKPKQFQLSLYSCHLDYLGITIQFVNFKF